MLQPRHVIGDVVTVSRRGLSCIGTGRKEHGGQDPTQLNLHLNKFEGRGFSAPK